MRPKIEGQCHAVTHVGLTVFRNVWMCRLWLVQPLEFPFRQCTTDWIFRFISLLSNKVGRNYSTHTTNEQYVQLYLKIEAVKIAVKLQSRRKTSKIGGLGDPDF